VSRESGARTPRDDDRALCVAYVDGLLSHDEQLAFELRLAADPELAARVRKLLETDELLREAQREMARETQRAARRRPVMWIVSLAAAAALLAWLAVALLRAPSRATFEVAVAPSFESAVEFVASEPTLAGLAPPGLETLRSGANETNIDAERFVELAAQAELRRARAALETHSAEIAAPFFVLPIRLGEPSEVAVFALAAGAPVERLFPREGESSATLPAGEHVLPSGRFEHVGDGAASRVRYVRGYLMPVGPDELRVVVAVRPPRSQPASEPESWKEALLARDAAGLEATLALAGCSTRVVVVRAPR